MPGSQPGSDPHRKASILPWNRKACHPWFASWAGRKEKPSVKQLEELRSEWAVQAAEEEEAEETQSSPTQLNLLRDRPLPCEEEKETVTKETVMW